MKSKLISLALFFLLAVPALGQYPYGGSYNQPSGAYGGTPTYYNYYSPNFIYVPYPVYIYPQRTAYHDYRFNANRTHWASINAEKARVSAQRKELRELTERERLQALREAEEERKDREIKGRLLQERLNRKD